MVVYELRGSDDVVDSNDTRIEFRLNRCRLRERKRIGFDDSHELGLVGDRLDHVCRSRTKRRKNCTLLVAVVGKHSLASVLVGEAFEKLGFDGSDEIHVDTHLNLVLQGNLIAELRAFLAVDNAVLRGNLAVNASEKDELSVVLANHTSIAIRDHNLGLLLVIIQDLVLIAKSTLLVNLRGHLAEHRVAILKRNA